MSIFDTVLLSVSALVAAAPAGFYRKIAYENCRRHALDEANKQFNHRLVWFRARSRGTPCNCTGAGKGGETTERQQQASRSEKRRNHHADSLPAGSLNLNVAPRGALGAAHSRPPWRWMIV